MTADEIKVMDLNEAEISELTTLLGVTCPPDRSVTTDGHRDIAMAAVVIAVSIHTLRLLALWIARHTESHETEISVQTCRPDGSLKTIIFRSKHNSSQSDAEVLKQLAEACRIDINLPELSEGGQN